MTLRLARISYYWYPSPDTGISTASILFEGLFGVFGVTREQMQRQESGPDSTWGLNIKDEDGSCKQEVAFHVFYFLTTPILGVHLWQRAEEQLFTRP